MGRSSSSSSSATTNTTYNVALEDTTDAVVGDNNDVMVTDFGAIEEAGEISTTALQTVDNVSGEAFNMVRDANESALEAAVQSQYAMARQNEIGLEAVASLKKSQESGATTDLLNTINTGFKVAGGVAALVGLALIWNKNGGGKK